MDLKLKINQRKEKSQAGLDFKKIAKTDLKIVIEIYGLISCKVFIIYVQLLSKFWYDYFKAEITRNYIDTLHETIPSINKSCPNGFFKNK